MEVSGLGIDEEGLGDGWWVGGFGGALYDNLGKGLGGGGILIYNKERLRGKNCNLLEIKASMNC